ncbi:hypothetical protein KP79_PYT09315 [Mizuhopecten yessoensis]|uniref:Uncharacterized protein n=1 Tax=Mizuhopecten yessoensis TaxID=6573 RepID=A0A210QCG3_MIZYE|nr:hypothetical protein KP79_PYT09315 [Mizuhopecten yessoensis]
MSEPGSLEDIFQTGAKQNYKFNEKSIPKGSATFQLVVTDCEGEKKVDTDDDDDDDEMVRPSVEYMGRRRNTVGEAYGSNIHRKSVHFDTLRSRKASLLPGMLKFRSRSPSPNLSVVEEGMTTRTRSLSPLVQTPGRRNSISAQDLAFGTTKDRECVIR